MFNNDYKKELDAVTPSEESVAALKEKMAATKKKRTVNPAALTASVLAACLVLAVISGIFALSHVSANRAPRVFTAVAASDYATLYKSINSRLPSSNIFTIGDMMFGMSSNKAENTSESMDDSAAAPGVNKGDSTQKDDYSDTNIQVEGVQEGDIVKTDGRYIYILRSNETQQQIRIVKVNNDGTVTEQSTVLLRINEQDDDAEYKDVQYSGMYIRDGILIVTGSRCFYYYGLTYGGNTAKTYTPDIPETFTMLYDVSDTASPKLINTFSQTGTVSSTRMIDNIVYTVTVYRIYDTDIDENEPETYVPMCGDGSKYGCLDANDIFIADNKTSATYTVITAVNVDDGGSIVSSKAVLGASDNIYASTENLYIAQTDYSYSVLGTILDGSSEGTTETCIMRFSFNDGNLSLDATGKVSGVLNNQFSMDEYNGYFRMVTTSDKGVTTVNNLYVLDNALSIVGSIENVAEDERVYSVRFDGDIGYFVTYRQTDPLFSVDLSDPTSPKILGALKIPGFSTYMQKFGKDLMLGIGYDDSFNVKLSMFNVTDKANVTEECVESLDISWTEALYNHKAILVNYEKNMIGFASEDYLLTQTDDGAYLDTQEYMYYIYGYDELSDSFTLRAKLDTGDINGMRGLYINDYFYVIGNDGIIVYTISDFTQASLTQF